MVLVELVLSSFHYKKNLEAVKANYETVYKYKDKNGGLSSPDKNFQEQFFALDSGAGQSKPLMNRAKWHGFMSSLLNHKDRCHRESACN